MEEVEQATAGAGLVSELFHEYGGAAHSPSNEFVTAAAIVGIPAALASGANLTKEALAYLRENPVSVSVESVRRSGEDLSLDLLIRNNRGHGCSIRLISVGDEATSFAVPSMSFGLRITHPSEPILIRPSSNVSVRAVAKNIVQGKSKIEVYFQFFDREPPEGKIKSIGKALARAVGLGKEDAEERFESVIQDLFVPRA